MVNEDRVSITNYGSGHAMELYYILHKLFNHCFSGKWMGLGDKMGGFA